MGAWGYGILENDDAADAQAAFEEALEHGRTFDAATWDALERCSGILPGAATDEPEGLLGLAAAQLEHGEIHEWLKGKVLRIVNRHRGLALWRDEGEEAVALHEEARSELREAILGAKVRKVSLRDRPPPRQAPPPLDPTALLQREQAIQAMGAARVRELTEAELNLIVQILLTDPGSNLENRNLRFSAGTAANDAQRRKAIPDRFFAPMIAALASPDPAVRLRAAESLFPVHDIQCLLDPILPLLSDERPKVRAAAARALWWWRIVDSRVLPPVVRLLYDSHPDCRSSAAIALGGFANLAGLLDPSALPPLVEMLSSSNADERKSAAATIAYMADRGATDSSALPALLRLLEDKSDDTVERGALAIANHARHGVCDPEALPGLTNRLSRGNRGSLVPVLSAVGALAERGFVDDSAVPLLEKLSKSSAFSHYYDYDADRRLTVGDLARPVLEKIRTALAGNPRTQ
jgi:HEAT repeat protein